MIDKCKNCGSFIYSANNICRCKPFKIYYPEYFGEDKETYYGNSFEDVAEKLAMWVNEGEYEVNTNIFESPIEVENENGIVKYFNVYAEPEINYYPKETKS